MNAQLRLIGSDCFDKYRSDICSLFTEIFCINNIATGSEAEDLSREKVKDLHRFVKDNSAVLIGAFDEDELLGFAWLYEYVFAGKRRLHLTEIAVKSQFRGLGVGRNLLIAAEEAAKSKGISAIDLYTSVDNVSAMTLYERAGFAKRRIHFVKEF